MRRSICYCEPNVCHAGEVNTWQFIYTPCNDLPKGTKLKFDLMSSGRDIDWEIPTVNLKKTRNIIYGALEDDTIISAKEIETSDSIAPCFEFTLPSAVKAGHTFAIIIGSPQADPETGTRAQTNAQRRRTFNLYVDTKGKGQYGEAEVFSMDIRGGDLTSIRILAPSFVARNKRFDVIVRFEDEYGNLTGSADEETLIELSHEHLRENLSWKLFIPETGFINLPNLYFNEPGVYTLQLRNTRTKEIFRSAPIRCFAENSHHLFWGLFHGESDKFDSTENIESCLRHFRDDRALNFYGVSPFESQEETSNETWKLISQNISDFDEADRFATFLGFQWVGNKGEEGVRQIVYNKDGKQLLRKKDLKYSSLNKLYKCFSPKELISIPCFTMGKGFEYNFKNYNPDFERVVEIYNSWGSSEQTKKEGNELPITSPSKSGVHESAEGSIQAALQENCRFGFVAGGLDDRGIYTELFESDQVQYTPGLTAIVSSEHSRTSLAEALYNRSCYATTGERIILGLSLAGVPMGGETSTAEKHGLKVNRHLSGYVAGTSKIVKVEIIRNGKVIKTFESDTYWLDFTFDDMTPIEKVAIKPKDKKPPFIYYYIRFTQEDGHMAWSSPIWVDYIAGAPITKSPSRRLAASKQAKKAVLPEEDEDMDDDFDDDFDD